MHKRFLALLQQLPKRALSAPEERALYKEFKICLELAQTLKQARKASDLTQKIVAQRMGTTTAVIACLESAEKLVMNSPSLATLVQYATAIGCNLIINLQPLAEK